MMENLCHLDYYSKIDIVSVHHITSHPKIFQNLVHCLIYTPEPQVYNSMGIVTGLGQFDG